MQMIIELPDDYKALISHAKLYNGSIASAVILNTVKNGIAIPKNHGRLIDEHDLIFEDLECIDGNTYSVVHAPSIDNAPTILEPDKED